MTNHEAMVLSNCEWRSCSRSQHRKYLRGCSDLYFEHYM